MHYPDMSGFYTRPRQDVAVPDMNGFLAHPLPGFRASSGPDMNGFRVMVPGHNTGGYQCHPQVDGPSFSSLTMPSANSSNFMAYGNGVWCTAVGSVNNTNLMRFDIRDNQLNWTLLTLPVSADWKVMATNGKGQWVMFAGNNGFSNIYVISEDNGLTWTQKTAPSSQNWYVCEYSNGVYLLVAFGSALAWISADGYNWTAVSLPSTKNWRGAAGNNQGLWVLTSDAGSSGGAGVAISKNGGVTWSVGTAIIGSTSPLRSSPDGTIWQCGTANCFATRDGLTWVSSPLGFTGFSFDYINGVYVATPNGTSMALNNDPMVNQWTIANNVMPSSAFWTLRSGAGIMMAVQTSATPAAFGIV